MYYAEWSKGLAVGNWGQSSCHVFKTPFLFRVCQNMCQLIKWRISQSFQSLNHSLDLHLDNGSSWLRTFQLYPLNENRLDSIPHKCNASPVITKLDLSFMKFEPVYCSLAHQVGIGYVLYSGLPSDPEIFIQMKKWTEVFVLPWPLGACGVSGIMFLCSIYVMPYPPLLSFHSPSQLHFFCHKPIFQNAFLIHTSPSPSQSSTWLTCG